MACTQLEESRHSWTRAGIGLQRKPPGTRVILSVPCWPGFTVKIQKRSEWYFRNGRMNVSSKGKKRTET